MHRYSAEEIEEKVNSFRMMLQEKQEPPAVTGQKPVWVQQKLNKFCKWPTFSFFYL